MAHSQAFAQKKLVSRYKPISEMLTQSVDGFSPAESRFTFVLNWAGKKLLVSLSRFRGQRKPCWKASFDRASHAGTCQAFQVRTLPEAKPLVDFDDFWTKWTA